MHAPAKRSLTIPPWDLRQPVRVMEAAMTGVETDQGLGAHDVTAAASIEPSRAEPSRAEPPIARRILAGDAVDRVGRPGSRLSRLIPNTRRPAGPASSSPSPGSGRPGRDSSCSHHIVRCSRPHIHIARGRARPGRILRAPEPPMMLAAHSVTGAFRVRREGFRASNPSINRRYHLHHGHHGALWMSVMRAPGILRKDK